MHIFTENIYIYYRIPVIGLSIPPHDIFTHNPLKMCPICAQLKFVMILILLSLTFIRVSISRYLVEVVVATNKDTSVSIMFCPNHNLKISKLMLYTGKS